MMRNPIEDLAAVFIESYEEDGKAAQDPYFVDIVAFSDDGVPLVFDERRARLIPAEHLAMLAPELEFIKVMVVPMDRRYPDDEYGDDEEGDE